MTPEQFEVVARRCKNRDELEQLAKNALSRSRPDLAEFAHELADELFPIRAPKRTGPTPSTVTFKGLTEHFGTGKDGYIWLVDQFGLNQSSIYEEYQDFHIRRKSRGSRIARTPRELFPAGSLRAANSSHYAKIVGGWYVDTNLNHVEKLHCYFNSDASHDLNSKQTGILKSRVALRN